MTGKAWGQENKGAGPGTYHYKAEKESKVAQLTFFYLAEDPSPWNGTAHL